VTKPMLRSMAKPQGAIPPINIPRPIWIFRSGTSASGSYADIIALAGLLAASLLFTVRMVLPIHSFARGDWPSFFFPMYAYLGERLRAGDLPGWNPYAFSGTPFAGDPESGWGYIPAMLIYGLLPAEPATVLFIGFHIAFAAFATYAFARLLDLEPKGAFLAGSVFAFSWVAVASGQLVIWAPVSTWMIVALAGAELSAQATSRSRLLWGWLTSGFALSQIVAVWLGQGAVYAVLVVSAWIFYRTLLMPRQAAAWSSRIVNLIVNGTGVLLTALGLSALSLLPRLDVISRSNLAGADYSQPSAWEDLQTGFSVPELLFEILGGYTGSLWWYVGAVGFGLALLSPIVARDWSPWPFFVAVGVVTLTLSIEQTTPVHNLIYMVIPRFQTLHEHSPERILILVSPFVALLAGATLSYLPARRGPQALLAIVCATLGVAALALLLAPFPYSRMLSQEVIVIFAASSALVLTFAVGSGERVRSTALAGLLLFALWDPAGRLLIRGFSDESRLERSLSTMLGSQISMFLYANPAANYIKAQSAREPARYAGFGLEFLPDPSVMPDFSPEIGYRGSQGKNEQLINWLLVFNWGTWFRISDIQGYNPIQNKRYVEYVDALNGHKQEYHERDVFSGGLNSPLLDMLNLRFLIVPAGPDGLSTIGAEVQGFQPVYDDDHVMILRNQEAFPRAWLVHDAIRLPSTEVLAQLAMGDVNPRELALLETEPPAMQKPTNPVPESVAFVHSNPDSRRLRVTANGSGLLVLSEVWDPGWTAEVNGKPAPVLRANYALQAVLVPGGESVVDFRYDPPLLKPGLLISFSTMVVLIAAALHGRSRPFISWTPKQ
jgi:hypothetical protein